jgi:hypothetical protein
VTVTPVTFPIDYNAVRKALIATVTTVTKLICITEEPEVQNAPRPTNPYMSFKITTPGAKSGDDSVQWISGSKFNVGGQREMTVSFHCYGTSHEEAYNYMTLWQGSLELKTIQQLLRKSGIAVWIIGAVADLSQLLNTGYEGRSQMDVQFGLASNLTDDPGEIDTVGIQGTVETDSGTVSVDFTVPEE